MKCVFNSINQQTNPNDESHQRSLDVFRCIHGLRGFIRWSHSFTGAILFPDTSIGK